MSATTATSAIYRRLSKDRADETSTVRQEAECRVRAEADGLAVAEVFTDLLSGYRVGTQRPGFDAAVEWVCAQPGRTLYVWKLDRLSRRGIGQVGTVLDRLEAARSRIVFVTDNLDTTVTSSRLAIALLSELARAESENTSTRTKSALAARRRAGRWPGGRPPYGFLLAARQLPPGADPASFAITEDAEPGTLVTNPATEPILRRIVEDVTDGKTTYAVARELAAEGIAGPRGGYWRVQTLADLLASPVLVGWLPEKKGSRDPARDPKSREPIVCGEPLLTLAERTRLLKALDERVKTTSKGAKVSAGRAPKALLTGIARCGACGSAMTGGGSKGNTRYACTLRASGGGCSGNTASLVGADAFVTEAVLRRWAASNPEDLAEVAAILLGVPTVTTEGAKREALEADLAEAKARLDDLVTLRLEPEFRGAEGRTRFASLSEPLLATIAAAEIALAEVAANEPDLGVLLDPEELREVWDAIDMRTRRAALVASIATVEVRKALKMGQRWDPEARLHILWRLSAPTM